MEKKIFVLCGPGGVGKSEIAKAVAEKMGLKFVTAYTTRDRRKEETNRDYNFVSKDEFLSFVQEGEMAEYSLFCGDYYGRKRADFENALSCANMCLTIIDPISIKDIKNLGYFKDKKVIIIFIDADDCKLKERLTKRREKEEILVRKLKNAKSERENKQFCDFVVQNNDFDECISEICKIIEQS